MQPLFSCKISDRTILCSSSSDSTPTSPSQLMIFGGADHELHEIEPRHGIQIRSLYSKNAGHSEWVTCVDSLPGGGYVSGGMDSKVCVWPGVNKPFVDGVVGRWKRSLDDGAVGGYGRNMMMNEHEHEGGDLSRRHGDGFVTGTGKRQSQVMKEKVCRDFIGHSGSISCVKAYVRSKYAMSGNNGRGHHHQTSQTTPNSNGTFILSSSYDGDVRLWDNSGRPRCLAICKQDSLESGPLRQDQRHSASSTGIGAKRPAAVLGFQTSNDILASWTRDGQIHVHSLHATSQTVGYSHRIQAHQGPVNNVLFLDEEDGCRDGEVNSSGGNLLISSGATDGGIRCYDLRISMDRGRCIGRMENVHAGGVTGFVRVATKGGNGNLRPFFATAGGSDGLVKVLEVDGGRPRLVYSLRSTPGAASFLDGVDGFPVNHVDDDSMRALNRKSSVSSSTSTSTPSSSSLSLSTPSSGHASGTSSLWSLSSDGSALPQHQQPPGRSSRRRSSPKSMASSLSTSPMVKQLAIGCRISDSISGKASTVITGQFVPTPSQIAYALTSVPEVRGVIVGWGDGLAHLISNASANPKITALNAGQAGVSNALRCFEYVDLLDKGKCGMLVGAGDDGVVVGWKTSCG
ncbi:hypothetical protein HDU76_002819 [Blyttiomyces sp. JEL0837]|nr:hypothetical protein HDU76_002819 [Blyttiomyces sp. JEL0837]